MTANFSVPLGLFGTREVLRGDAGGERGGEREDGEK